MSEANIHGLSRTIPAQTKRTVRKAAGFGCVVCGSAIVEYEHIDPPFSECREHDPECITLLCPTCHAKKTKGLLSLEKIWEAKANPAAKKKGFANEFWDMGQEIPDVHLGSLKAIDCDNILTIGEQSVIAIREPEEPGAPVRFNADIRTADGQPIFTVVDNEWRCNAENWDVEQVGSKLLIRESLGKKLLELIITPQKAIDFRLIDLSTRGFHLRGDSGQFFVEYRGGQFELQSGEIDGYLHAVLVDEETGAVSIGHQKGGKHGRLRAALGGLQIGPAPRIFPKLTPPLAKAPNSRNARCTCGSGKRYKHCCGRF